MIKFYVQIIFVGATIFLTSSSRESERITASTEKVVASSVQLQKLHDICRDLPYFESIEPTSKGLSRQKDELYYHYDLRIEPNSAMAAAKDYLSSRGWTFLGNEKGIWEDQIEFEKGDYWIRVSHGSFGESNFATTCRDRAIAGRH